LSDWPFAQTVLTTPDRRTGVAPARTVRAERQHDAVVKAPSSASISPRPAQVGILVQDATILAKIGFSVPRGRKEVDLRLP
jgi:hypothetical protein